MRGASLAADGGRIAVRHETEAVVLDGKTGAVVATRPLTRGGMALSPDGQTLATADGTVEVWDVAAGKRRWPDVSAGGHTSSLAAAAWSKDGATVVTAGYDGRVFAWDARTGAKRRHASVAPDLPRGAAVVGDEVRAVACSVGPGNKTVLRAWDAATGTPRRTTTLDAPKVDHTRSVVVGPAGATFIDDRKSECRVTSCDAATGRRSAERTMPTVHEYAPAAPSSDGRFLAWGGPRVQRLADGRPTAALDGADGAATVSGLAWNADGTLLAATLSEKGRSRLLVWERASGRLAWAFATPADSAYVSWSPDGRSLLLQGGRGKNPLAYDLTIGASAEGLPAWSCATSAPAGCRRRPAASRPGLRKRARYSCGTPAGLRRGRHSTPTPRGPTWRATTPARRGGPRGGWPTPGPSTC